MKIMLPLGTGSCWEDNLELKCCLRSIEQNLKGDYEIEIYGDAPEWITNVTVVKTERYYPEWLKEKKLKEGKGLDYENFFDTLNKVKMFAQENEGNFLYMYDDVLVIKEVNVNEIKNVPLEEEKFEYYQIRKFEKHGRTINKSIDLLKEGLRLNINNFETHLPRIYDCYGLRWLFEEYDFTGMEIPFSLATLYFNVFTQFVFETPLSKINFTKAGFYGINENVASYLSSSLQEIEVATKDKIFVNYNDMGLNCMATDLSGKQYLKEWIMNKFSTKSRYEL